MRFRSLLALTLLPLSAVPKARSADPEALVEAELPSLVTFYEDLHAHPELSLHEELTAAKLAMELKSAGFEVTEKVGGFGLVGVLRNGDGPVLLLRTDMDALPVRELTGLSYASQVKAKDDQGREVPVMHACGHDMHMACFIGTARVLARLKDSWRGTLVMIGQPAEERVLGARMMLKAGLFDRFPKPDHAIGLHCSSDLPHGTVGMIQGFALANVDTVDIVVKGVGSHGSMPQLGKDPVVLASQIVLALQTIVSREVKPGDPAVVTVGSIHGGTKHNIIPDEVRLQLTLRSYKAETRQHLIDSVERITRNLAQASGMPEEKMPEVIVSDERAPSLYNEPALTQRVRRAVENRLGTKHVITRDPTMGAEDFAEYGLTKEKVPLCFFWLGTQRLQVVTEAAEKGETLPSLHSPFFRPVPEPTIKTGILALTSAALELLQRP